MICYTLSVALVYLHQIAMVEVLSACTLRSVCSFNFVLDLVGRHSWLMKSHCTFHIRRCWWLLPTCWPHFQLCSWTFCFIPGHGFWKEEEATRKYLEEELHVYLHKELELRPWPKILGKWEWCSHFQLHSVGGEKFTSSSWSCNKSITNLHFSFVLIYQM